MDQPELVSLTDVPELKRTATRLRYSPRRVVLIASGASAASSAAFRMLFGKREATTNRQTTKLRTPLRLGLVRKSVKQLVTVRRAAKTVKIGIAICILNGLI